MTGVTDQEVIRQERQLLKSAYQPCRRRPRALQLQMFTARQMRCC